MKTYQSILQTSIILIIIGLNSYSIGQGIRIGSGWGIALAIGSLSALAYCIYLFKKLNQANAGEDYKND